MKRIAILALILCLLLCACEAPQEAQATPAPVLAEATDETVVLEMPTPRPTPVPTPSPTPTAAPTPTPTPTPTPEPTPELITNARLDAGEFDRYFDDVLFVGDSLTLIFSHYVRDVRRQDETFLGDAKFLATTSMSAKRASENSVRENAANFSYRGRNVTLCEGIQKIAPRQVFLMFGLNDLCVRDWDEMIDCFGKIIDQIRETNPDVQITIEGVLPVRRAFYDRQPPWNTFNERLQQLCGEKGVEFVSFAEELTDENGELRKDLCGDGKCHLNIAGEQVWVRFLRRYAAQALLGTVSFETQ